MQSPIEAVARRLSVTLAGVVFIIAADASCRNANPQTSNARLDSLPPIVRAVLNEALAKEELTKRRGPRHVAPPYVSFPFPICAFENGLCGAVNRDGSIVVTPRFDFVDEFHEGRAVVRSVGLYGYVDTNDKLVVEPQYAYAGRYRLGLAEVDIGGKSALIDLEGRQLLGPRFAGAVPFTKTVFWVNDGIRDLGRLRPGREELSGLPFRLGNPFRDKAKWGLIDAAGAWIRKPEFRDLAGFDPENDELVWARADTGWGLIRPDGTWALEPTFNNKHEISDGLAAVWQSNKVGFVDRAGQIVIPPKFEPLGTREFFDGMPAPAQLGGRIGLIDRSGNWVVEPTYNSISSYHGGSSASNSDLEFNGFLAIRGSLTDILDRTGKVLIGDMKLWSGTSTRRALPGGGISFTMPMMQFPMFCEDGRIIGFYDYKPRLFERDGTPLDLQQAELWWPLTCEPPYVIKVGSRFAHTDKALRLLTAERFDAVGLFRDGLAAVVLAGKYGLIRHDETWAVAPKFDVAHPLQNDLVLAKLGGRAGLVNASTGAWVTQTRFDDMCPSAFGISGVVLDGKVGAIDSAGAWVIQPKYDAFGFGGGYISGFHTGLIPVRSGDKWGFVDSTGKEVIPVRFDAVSLFERGVSWTRMGDEWCPIDRSGNKGATLPCQNRTPVNIFMPSAFSCQIPRLAMAEAPQ
jgi:hypothetical protein